jgi:hypothetical protein
MQYDRTRIAIRERDLPDLMDLSLQVVRVHALAWLAASVVGMLPFALFNYWLLNDLPFVESRDYVAYTARMVMLVLFEAPLASVPTTLLLGQAMFVERFDVARVARQAIDSLPQLLFYQVLFRVLFMPQALFWGSVHGDLVVWTVLLGLLWFFPFAKWPYLNEVILLERNPLFSRKTVHSTWKRSQILHARYASDLFGRLIGCAFIAAALAAALWLATWDLRSFFSHDNEIGRTMFTVHLPVALWTVAALFNVVRFLSYLDLRIRREGWEVELMLRAEADRLVRQHQFQT